MLPEASKATEEPTQPPVVPPILFAQRQLGAWENVCREKRNDNRTRSSFVFMLLFLNNQFLIEHFFIVSQLNKINSRGQQAYINQCVIFFLQRAMQNSLSHCIINIYAFNSEFCILNS